MIYTYADYRWEECTKEEYDKLVKDCYLLAKKEPIYDEGKGII